MVLLQYFQVQAYIYIIYGRVNFAFTKKKIQKHSWATLTIRQMTDSVRKPKRRRSEYMVRHTIFPPNRGCPRLIAVEYCRRKLG